MAEIVIRIEGEDKLKRVMLDPRLIGGPMKTFLAKSALLIEAEAKKVAPVDTGRLRTSITHHIQERRAIVGAGVFYAPFVEFGTRPHWPPRGVLQPWARRHGFPAGRLGDWLVRAAIARRGTRAQPFMRPAVKAALPGIKTFLRELALDIQKRWKGHAI